MARDASRVRLGAASFAIAGVLFLLYPAIRPFSDETSLQGAAAFASTAWILAHMLAMVGFTLVMLGLLGLYLAFRATAVEGIAFWALAVGLLSIGLLLPFYGGEAFGLHAIGEEALRQRSLALVGLASVVRSGPELIMFLIGLLLLAASAIVTAVAIWKSGTLAKWSGVPFAIGFALLHSAVFRESAGSGRARSAGDGRLPMDRLRHVAACTPSRTLPTRGRELILRIEGGPTPRRRRRGASRGRVRSRRP